MSGAHSDIGPELRRLAQTILDGIEPAVRAAAALAGGGGSADGGTGKCQQTWCPVCALAALASGEQHPLLTVIADHSVALLDVVRGLVGDVGNIGGVSDHGADLDDPNRSGAAPPAGGTNGDPAATTTTRYQPIPVTVDE